MLNVFKEKLPSSKWEINSNHVPCWRAKKDSNSNLSTLNNLYELCNRSGVSGKCIWPPILLMTRLGQNNFRSLKGKPIYPWPNYHPTQFNNRILQYQWCTLPIEIDLQSTRWICEKGTAVLSPFTKLKTNTTQRCQNWQFLVSLMSLHLCKIDRNKTFVSSKKVWSTWICRENGV